jgi:hypothetical protein
VSLLDLTEWISICDIGGLGEPPIPAIRFYTYYIDFNKGFSPVLTPEFTIDDSPKTLEKYYLSAQNILIRLYNLSLEIIPIEDNEVMVAKKIIKWCSDNIHPYNINKIYDSIPNIDDFHKEVKDLYISPRSWYEGKVEKALELAEINLFDFLKDLRRLHELVKTYYGIFSFQDGDSKIIEELKTVLQYESQWNRLAKKILEEKKISKDTLKKFAESIPDVQLSVKFDENKNSFYIGPKFDSIFDIATYALIRLVITNAPNMDDTDIRKTLFVCQACGKIGVKTGNRQKYCDIDSCQNVRNSRKTARSKKRKKDK